MIRQTRKCLKESFSLRRIGDYFTKKGEKDDFVIFFTKVSGHPAICLKN